MPGREKRNLLFCQEEADWQRNYKNQSVKGQDYNGEYSHEPGNNGFAGPYI
jgi:hypothetical protein